MFFCITVSTKEINALKNFLVFFAEINFSTPNFSKQKSKKKEKKFLTVLKSPHINKTAQEQFEFRTFSSQIVMFSTRPFLFFSILKRIIKKRFPGVRLKIACIFDRKKYNKVLSRILNPDIIRFKPIIKKKDIKNYFYMFDYYGEVFLKQQLLQF